MSVLFVAWTRTSHRAEDIATELGGRAALVHPRVPLLPHPLSTAVRYAISAVLTLVLLVRHRPTAVVVTNPPLVPPLVVALWSRVTGRPFVLDSHPSGFGLKGRRGLARLQGVHAALARRADAVLVTTDETAHRVRSWGGTGLVVHEAPVAFPEPVAPVRATVLFVGIFASDEPVDVVVEAARRLPSVTFRVTGDPARAPKDLAVPANVELTGFLGREDYRQAVSGASLVLTLTTEPTSVMRSAYEAVYAGVPLVVTDTAVLRETFPFAVFCDNTATSVAAAVTQALDEQETLRDKAEAARELQLERWSRQLAALRAVLGT